jgi:CubicO group peptidase (beta-lactamase class C family)
MPGVVSAVGRGDAPPTFVSAGAISDDPGAPRAGPDSLWRIYSMTKPLTAVAAMILVEEGKLRLDQPISDFIPAFRNMRVLDDPAASLASHPANSQITVRHLLTHTSGLGYQILGNGPLQQEYRRLGLLGGRANAEETRAQPTSLAEFADRVATTPLLVEPGTQWNYSISLDVLGRVIEVAAGMPFERFVQLRLLDPLGMTSTYWTLPRSEAGRLATIYYFAETNRVPIDTGAGSLWLEPPRVHYGGAGLVSSARDYDRFLQMLAGHGSVGNVRVLRRETVDLALSNLLPDGVRVAGIATPDTDKAEGFGAGGWVYLADAPQGVRAGTYGWSGAGGTFSFIDPRQGLRVTVMVNYFPPNKWPLHRDVVRLLYAR